MNSGIPIGRILSSSNRAATVAYVVSENEIPPFGALVRIPVGASADREIFGLVTDIRIEEDGFLKQLATGTEIAPEILLDTRVNRNVPIVMSVLFVGTRRDGIVSHLLPPRPPLTLDGIFVCDDADLVRFTGVGHFGYFRHLQRAQDVPFEDLLAAHFQAAIGAHQRIGRPEWGNQAVAELVELLNTNYDLLTGVFGALSDTGCW